MEPCLLQDLPYLEYKEAEALPLERCEIIARLANLKLATPSIDCATLGHCLKNLGFIVVTIKNSRSMDLMSMLEKTFELIPENSYGFIFYAGHGCEICNTKCMLGIDCPSENMKEEHCITENAMLNAVVKCKPELCVLIMDMCCINLDRITNPEIYTSILYTQPTNIHRNLLIAYATQPSAAAYELVEIECSMTIDNDVTYEMKTGDTDRIVPNASQYVNALCNRLEDDLDVSTLLDKVHADVEKSMKKQRPIKVQCGTDKRSLYDPATGDAGSILNKLKDVEKDWKEFYNAF
ncbi:mucosa-associated lymphoid tissue lymphoma translocation protein 1 homolog isoform X2 [Pectinophora gossypiella]|uniref:mucosa-associated lymphoid tissue lymphoma translocation protein 1 homolog isoform X2 n=1 Tax=Pectinophora gossypiella TaxID=13191 RepID=UPI00214DFA29|nr:mucosa-associated lymphoid tissue lymphoma translocation protein 1 homolog isoform X2 [Pectinophora gossypiella]